MSTSSNTSARITGLLPGWYLWVNRYEHQGVFATVAQSEEQARENIRNELADCNQPPHWADEIELLRVVDTAYCQAAEDGELSDTDGGEEDADDL